MKGTHPSEWRVGTSYDPYDPNAELKLNEIKEAGFDYIELVLSSSHQDLNLEGLREKFNPSMEFARNLGLNIWSVHLPFGDSWDISILDLEKRNEILEYHYEWIKWVSEWNVNKVIIHPSFEPILDQQRLDRIQACRQSLAKLNEKAKQFGFEICVECLPRTCLGNSSTEIKNIIKNNEELGVCCDVNHLLNEKPEDFIIELGSKISTLHMSDYDGIDEKHW